MDAKLFLMAGCLAGIVSACMHEKSDDASDIQKVVHAFVLEADSLMQSDSLFWNRPIDKSYPQVCIHDSLIRQKLDSAIALHPDKQTYLSSKKERTEVAFSSIPEEGEMRYLLSDDYPLGSLLEHELEEEIHHAIRNLPEVCRKVFIKSRFEGKKYEEIATELNISVNTVKYHIKSALSSLHSELGKYLIILILFFSTFK